MRSFLLLVASAAVLAAGQSAPSPENLGYHLTGIGTAMIAASASGPVAVWLSGDDPAAVISYRTATGGPPLRYRHPFTLHERLTLTAESPAGPVRIFALELPEAEYVGPFRWLRKLHDPLRELPDTESALGDRESVTIAGDRLCCRCWQGDSKAGRRAWSGNWLALPPGANAWIALDDYRLTTHDVAGTWEEQHCIQDAHLRLCFFAAPALSLPARHGGMTAFTEPFAADALVVDLAFRHPGWNGHDWVQWGWTVGSYPQSSGVFEVRRGESLGAAKEDPQRKLSDGMELLRILGAETKDLAFRFQVGAGGSWQLLVDVGRDGTPDLAWRSGEGLNRPSGLAEFRAQSGLVLLVEPAGGNKPGRVGRTRIEFNAALTGEQDLAGFAGPTHPRAVAALTELRKAEERCRAEAAAKLPPVPVKPGGDDF